MEVKEAIEGGWVEGLEVAWYALVHGAVVVDPVRRVVPGREWVRVPYGRAEDISAWRQEFPSSAVHEGEDEVPVQEGDGVGGRLKELCHLAANGVRAEFPEVRCGSTTMYPTSSSEGDYTFRGRPGERMSQRTNVGRSNLPVSNLRCLSPAAGIVLFGGKVAAALQGVSPTENASDRLRVGSVFFGEDAHGEAVRGVGVEDRYGALKDDGAVVQVLVDKVDRAARNFHAVVERLLLCVEAGKGGEQRRVDVKNAVGEGLDEDGRKQPHVAGEDDEIDTVLSKRGNHLRVVV